VLFGEHLVLEEALYPTYLWDLGHAMVQACLIYHQQYAIHTLLQPRVLYLLGRGEERAFNQ
jgi:hypothetical protein